MSVHEKRPMKRSRAVVLTTLSAAGVAALSACGSSEEEVDSFPYATVAECERAGDVPASECQAAYNQALANHELSAPRFESQALCEEEFGNNGCQTASSGGSFWMPVLAGFMVGRMLDNDRSYYRHSGLYRHRRHGWYAGGNYGGPLISTNGRYRSGMSAYDRPSAASPIHTRSSVTSRGGFGSRSRASSGSRGG